MQIIHKDILDEIDPSKKTMVMHGCNAFHVMSAGIAYYLRLRYPEVLRVDKETTRRGDPKKLGTISVAEISPNFHIVNCYTQYAFSARYVSKPKMFADYLAIRSCLREIALRYAGWEIRSPKIGCGLAKGDWLVVADIFKEELGTLDVTIYQK